MFSIEHLSRQDGKHCSGWCPQHLGAIRPYTYIYMCGAGMNATRIEGLKKPTKKTKKLKLARSAPPAFFRFVAAVKARNGIAGQSMEWYGMGLFMFATLVA